MPNRSSSSIFHRAVTFVRILNMRLRFILIMVLVGLVIGYWENITNYYDRWTRPPRAEPVAAAQGTEYYCPMHPNVIRDHQDNCPICGMPLAERSKSEKPALPEGVLARVSLTPQKVAMGRIGTSSVDHHLLSREVRAVGIVEYDETRRAFIAARIKGRIDKLFVNYVGERVREGQPLAGIYSPDLLVAQEELLTAAKNLAQQKGGNELALTSAQAMVEASRKKLLLWGITNEQIDAIVRQGKPDTLLTIHSPLAGIVTEKKVLEGNYVEEGGDLYTVADLSRVWMQAKIFEDQIGGIQVGTAVEVASTAYPQEMFVGRITFIAYTVDPATRTVSARVEVENPDYKLKPGMYVNAVIRTPVGAVKELASASAPAKTSAAAVPTAPDVVAASGPAPSDQGAGVDELVQAYLKLCNSFSHDKADAPAATDLAARARQLATSVPEGLRVKISAIAEQAAQLEGKDLKEQRKILSPLSAKIIDLVKAHPPTKPTLYIAHCPMVKADWLQTGKDVENPYYGSEMFDCGEVTATIKPSGGGDERRFVTGYFCPILPDRVFEQPATCPVDRFPMKYVKLEKVLAIPESAVIDTGTRQIVYRESQPGVFDMLEVRLGIRAGDYYPVLSGLEPGDKIATAGAFLVDAENRLNPAVTATYFGASGTK